MALNIHCDQYATNRELLGEAPKLSEKIRQRRMCFTGHSSKSETKLVYRLGHWLPKLGVRKPGKYVLIYIDILKRDTGLEKEEIKTAMQDRKYGESLSFEKLTRHKRVSQ